MAYFNQDNKKELAPKIKNVLNKYGIKGTISVRNNMVLVVTLKSGKLDILQNYLDNFNIQTAFSNLAARQDYPKDNSFGGPLQCGRATHKGQLKKDGSVMYHCPYKFGFYYYKINDKQGKMVASCFLDDFDEYLKKYPESEYLYQTIWYSGCPAFQKCS